MANQIDSFKDFNGNTVIVGDKVIYMQIGYRNLTTAYVKSISPKMCLLGGLNDDVTFNYIKQFHDQVIKVILE